MVDPYALLFDGMAKLGPGSDEETLAVLQQLPPCSPDTIVDAGCGTGRQTLVLASALQQTVHAVDLSASFLDQLAHRAHLAGLGQLIKTHRLDMAELAHHFPPIDLLWSEGSAYSIGFANALRKWSAALAPQGLLVVSELCWLRDDVPPPVADFFSRVYPAMGTQAANTAVCTAEGYRVLGTHPLPESAWREGFYDELQPRARRLAQHDDETVRAVAAETLEEIEVFEQGEGSYGYLFFVLQRAA